MRLLVYAVFAFAGSVTTTLAAQVSPLNKRQFERVPCAEVDMKDCGEVCIDFTDTCCPDESGGCPAGAYCALGTNAEYGCCPTGEVCEGPGGANTHSVVLPGDTLTSTFIDTLTYSSFVETRATIETEIEEPPAETEVVETTTVTSEAEETSTSTLIVPPAEPTDDSTVPPVPLPTPIPTEGNEPPTTTDEEEPPQVTDAAPLNAVVLGNVVGGVIAVAAFLL